MTVAVVQFGGSNCDRDTVQALEALEIEAERVWHEDTLPADLDGIVLPGGFSYGDYLRAGAMAAHSPIMDEVKEAAEASMRDVVGSNEIGDILTTQKFEIQNDCQELLQRILDSYNSGIQVSSVKMQDVHPPDQVRDAFKDVASAREDKSTLINEARAYRNKIIPEARGRVATILNEAEAYKETKVRRARGEAARFDKLLAEYRKAERITRKRLYLEAMQDVFGSVRKKTILTDSASENMVPYLPLDQLSGTKQNLSKGTGQRQGSGGN